MSAKTLREFHRRRPQSRPNGLEWADFVHCQSKICVPTPATVHHCREVAERCCAQNVPHFVFVSRPSDIDASSTCMTKARASPCQHCPCILKPVPSISQSRDLQTRLAEVEVMMKDMCSDKGRVQSHVVYCTRDTQHKVRALECQARTVERQQRGLCLVLYNVPESSETEEEDDADAVASLVWGTHEDASQLSLSIDRLGTCSSEQNKHRPVMVKFKTMNNKHTFLKHAKQLKPAGIKWNEYLTRQQQISF